MKFFYRLGVLFLLFLSTACLMYRPIEKTAALEPGKVYRVYVDKKQFKLTPQQPIADHQPIAVRLKTGEVQELPRDKIEKLERREVSDGQVLGEVLGALFSIGLEVLLAH